MSWNYSGCFVTKQNDEIRVYADDEKELYGIADKGILRKRFRDAFSHLKDGVYQVSFGYGDHPNSEVLFYGFKFLGELNWNLNSFSDGEEDNK